jgi:hypothetical protein
MSEPLLLSEKLYLLSVNPEKGGIITATANALNYVLLGGLLLELYQNKNVSFENKRVVILETKSENELHRFMLEKIGMRARPLKISRALGKFNFSMKYILNGVQQNLVDKRMIRMEPKRFLFFKWKKPFLVNKPVVQKMVTEIERQIMNGSASDENLILLSFIQPSGLLNRIFKERSKRKIAKKRLKKMMVENQVSEAVAGAISAAQVVAASVGASVAVSAAVH